MKSIKFKKITSVLLILVICLGVLTANGLNLVTAAESEHCDAGLGTVTKSTLDGKTTLTVVPNENVGFRAWYCDGKEASLDKAITVNSTEASKYYAKLYDFNMVKNGNFEAYENGQNLKTLTGDDAWLTTETASTEVVVTNQKAALGSKSLRIKNTSGASYRKITGLDENSWYTLCFEYNFGNTADYLDYVSLLTSDSEVDASANLGKHSIDNKKFNSTSGKTSATEWKKLSFTFNSGENTELLFCLKYVGSNSIFIDNLTLVRDYISAPTNGNYDFENKYVGDWKVSDGKRASLGLDNNATYGFRLKGKTILSYGLVYSAPYEINSGFTYKFSYTLDLSSNDISSYIPEVDEGSSKLIRNADGTLKYTTTKSNLIFGLSTVAGRSSEVTYGKDHYIYKEITSYTGAYNDSNTRGTGCIKTVSDGRNTITLSNKYLSGDSINKDELKSKGIDVSKPLTITTTFTANKDCKAHIYVRLSGLGSYYIDNVKVERTTPANFKSNLPENEFAPVGTAIRLNSKQGIRFKTRISKQLLCSDNPYGIRAVEYGTVAALSDAVGTNELKIGAEYTVNGKKYSAKTGVAYSFEKGINKVFEETDRHIDFTGVLINISENNYLSDYAVRSYYKYYDANGTLQTVYSETYRPSIYDVAKEAYSAKNKDGSFAESDASREYLYNDILSLTTDFSISVGNTSAPINTDFEGVTSTVYHCYTFMDDEHGRTYTDEQAAIEMDRLKDSGITSVRTIFKSSFAAGNLKESYQNVVVDGVGSSVKTGESFDGWDWETSEMKAFYKWAKMLQDRDIDIILNAGWNIPFFITKTSSIPELFYLLGYEEGYSDSENYGIDITYGFKDKYNESAKYSFTGNETADERRMIIASLRYGEWMRQALEACEAHGVYNVKYLLAFTEPGRKDRADQDEIDPYYCYPQWTRLVQGLHDALKDAGIRNKYRIIGPNQVIYPDQNRPVSFLQYYLDFEKENPEYAGMVDILSSHIYARPLESETSINDPYACYDRSEASFEYFKNILEKNGAADRAFWCDEYNARAVDCTLGGGVGAQMTQFAAGFVAAMNNGVDNLISWQIFDQLWTSQTNTGGEFVGGVHACGTCPSFVTIDDKCTNTNCACHDYKKYASYTPYVTYYGLNLLGKYMSAKSGTVFSTTVTGDEKGGLYSSSMRDEKGNLVVLAVNTLGTATNVSFNAAKTSEYSKITRYTYNPNGITPTEKAISLASDGSFKVNGNSFYDTIPAMSFSIYVYEPAPSGDVDIPMLDD